MSQRAYELANEFDRATDALVKTVREMSDGDWERVTKAEGWTVAAVVQHVAAYMDIEADWVARIAAGKPVIPLSRDAIDSLNERMARENANLTKDKALQMIAGNRSAVRHFLISLTDEQLNMRLPGRSVLLRMPEEQEITLDWVAERIMVNHVRNHLNSIEETMAG